MISFLKILACAIGVFLLISTTPASALDIVKDGKPLATIVASEAPEKAAPTKGKRRPKERVARGPASDAMAAEVLAEWVKKMTGAELPIANVAPADGVVIYVGEAATEAGLKLDEIDSPTHEGVRIVCDGKRILIAGQDDTATVKAACRFLEELGCRYLMDSPLGEVYPHTATISVGELDIHQKPGLEMRKIWGSSWSGSDLWKIWNGAGGTEFAQGHSWGNYVSRDLFETHPEYFALKNGARKKGDWYCTSNPELRKIFVEGVIRRLDADGGVSASISPPDGVGYCECDKCRAQDDPNSIEPSSGRVCITDRYVDFFNDVARQVSVKYPNARLSFYCYADYTQAPTRGVKLEPNLVAWIAPLRYCRLHAIGNPICSSRMQLEEMINAWSKSAQHIGYRTYNFNPAECLVPFSLASVWEHDIPFLKQHGAMGMNMESLDSWQIYGPHLYLSLRLAYDPAADGHKLLDDYFEKFYGPAAGPIMKQYWLDVDSAIANVHAHAGSFYSVHKIYTPEFLAHCRQLLDRAITAAQGDATYTARVAMHAEGFHNAEQYEQLRTAMNSGNTAQTIDVYKQLLARTEAQEQAGYGNHYTPDYLKRFIGKQVAAITTATTPPSRIDGMLPDVWRMTYDPEDKGAAAGFAKPDFDDAGWKKVATYSDTLDGQGIPDRQTILWYRTTIDLPAVKEKPLLKFIDVDGNATVFINGKESGSSAKKRVPFDVDASALQAGHNVIAVRVDHSAITELSLGGIIRPVYLVSGAK